MDPDDMADLAAEWARRPPAPIALRRLENAVRALAGAPPVEDPKPSAPRRTTPRTEAELRALVDHVNGRG